MFDPQSSKGGAQMKKTMFFQFLNLGDVIPVRVNDNNKVMYGCRGYYMKVVFNKPIYEYTLKWNDAIKIIPDLVQKGELDILTISFT